MNVPLISVCIPAYEMHGRGGEYLSHSFGQLERQDFKDFDIVVSDQSRDSSVAEVCRRFSHSLRIRRIDNTMGKRQSTANLNNAMRHANGRIIKILFQDDFLTGEHSLSRTAAAFEDPSVSWVVTASAHADDDMNIFRPFQPRFHDRIHFGINTISSPSVVAIRNGSPPLFDENLIWLMDVEYYRRCKQRFGLPTIIDEVSVINRMHSGQVSNKITSTIKRRELTYVLKKHWRVADPGDVFHFLKCYRRARR